MLPKEIKVGHVLNYAYLWHHEMREGREEASKDRPCVVLVLVETSENGTSFVRVLPITHSMPADASVAVELPSSVKKRLRLDEQRSWVILSESNKFSWPGPDVRHPHAASEDGYYGPLPEALFRKIRDRFVELAQSGRHASFARTE